MQSAQAMIQELYGNGTMALRRNAGKVIVAGLLLTGLAGGYTYVNNNPNQLPQPPVIEQYTPIPTYAMPTATATATLQPTTTPTPRATATPMPASMLTYPFPEGTEFSEIYVTDTETSFPAVLYNIPNGKPILMPAGSGTVGHSRCGDAPKYGIACDTAVDLSNGKTLRLVYGVDDIRSALPSGKSLTRGDYIAQKGGTYGIRISMWELKTRQPSDPRDFVSGKFFR